MPHYIIERNFAEKVELDPHSTKEIVRINDEEGVKWIYSFLSADARKTYCLYEAPNPDAIRDAARRNNIPADAIIEVGSQTISAEMFA